MRRQPNPTTAIDIDAYADIHHANAYGPNSPHSPSGPRPLPQPKRSMYVETMRETTVAPKERQLWIERWLSDPHTTPSAMPRRPHAHFVLPVDPDTTPSLPNLREQLKLKSPRKLEYYRNATSQEEEEIYKAGLMKAMTERGDTRTKGVVGEPRPPATARPRTTRTRGGERSRGVGGDRGNGRIRGTGARPSTSITTAERAIATRQSVRGDPRATDHSNPNASRGGGFVRGSKRLDTAATQPSGGRRWKGTTNAKTLNATEFDNIPARPHRDHRVYTGRLPAPPYWEKSFLSGQPTEESNPGHPFVGKDLKDIVPDRVVSNENWTLPSYPSPRKWGAPSLKIAHMSRVNKFEPSTRPINSRGGRGVFPVPEALPSEQWSDMFANDADEYEELSDEDPPAFVFPQFDFLRDGLGLKRFKGVTVKRKEKKGVAPRPKKKSKDVIKGRKLKTSSGTRSKPEQTLARAAQKLEREATWRSRENTSGSPHFDQFLSPEEAATRIQTGFRGFIVKKKNRQEYAAVKVQRNFRGYLARKAYRVPRSALRIQCHWRGYEVRKRFWQKKAEAAATKIQAYYRGYYARRDAEDHAWGRSEFSIGEHKAATKIQSFMRGHAVRKTQKKRTKSHSSKSNVTANEPANEHQGKSDGDGDKDKEKSSAEEEEVDIEDTEETQKAAAFIQSRFKRTMSIRKASHKPEDDPTSRDKAATKIQSHYRGFTVRRATRRQRPTEEEEEVDIEDTEETQKAAAFIQSRFKRTMSIRKASHKPEDDPTSRDKAAVKIQSHYRGFAIRRHQRKRKELDQEAREREENEKNKHLQEDEEVDIEDTEETQKAALFIQSRFKRTMSIRKTGATK